MKFFIFFCFLTVSIVFDFVQPDCLLVDPPNLTERLYNLRLENDLILSPWKGKQSKFHSTILKEVNSNSTCPNSLDELRRENNNQQGESKDHRIFQTCPTYDMIDFNSERFPTTLPGKRCRCSHEKTQGCLREGSRTDEGYECSPISVKILVLMKTGDCDGQYARYEPFWDEQIVGCTCRISEKYFLETVKRTNPNELKIAASSAEKKMTTEKPTTFETTMKKFSTTTETLGNFMKKLIKTLQPQQNNKNFNYTTIDPENTSIESKSTFKEVYTTIEPLNNTNSLKPKISHKESNYTTEQSLTTQ